MSGANYNPQGGIPPQQGGYPQQGGQPQPVAPPTQPYGHAGYGAPPGYTGQYIPPPGLPVQCFGGFWIRFAAYLLDVVILSVPGFFIGVVIGLASVATSQAPGGGGQGMGLQLTANLVSIVLGWLYFSLMEVKYGGTLGKLAVGLRVVDENGMHQSFGRATGRFFSKILSGCLLLIGYIIAAFDPQKRALHDRIATTFVIRKEFVNPAQPR